MRPTRGYNHHNSFQEQYKKEPDFNLLYFFLSSLYLLYPQMADSITFPSASNMSKLSACPTTKLPQATDWIFQDFFNTMLNGDDLLIPSIQIAELFPQEKLTDATFNLLQSTFSDDCYEAWHDNNQSCTTMADDHISLPDLEETTKNSSSSIMISSDDEEDDDEEEENQELDMLEDHIHGVTFQSDLLQLSNVAPVLIESTISSCTTVSSVSFRQSMDTASISVNQALTKRKSTSSFSSFKSFMSVFHIPKKSKLDHDYPSMSASPVPAPTPAMTMVVLGGQQKKPSPVSSSFSKRFLKYFKRRCWTIPSHLCMYIFSLW